MTMIAVPITVKSAPEALAQAARAAEFGADLVEYRVDTLADDPQTVIAVVKGSPLPCIVTCRHADEGGAFDDEPSQRLSMLRQVLRECPPAYIDLELSHFDDQARLALQHDTTGLILSTHDFTTRPADLDRRIAAMAGEPTCRVIKAAWRARSLRDNLEAFEIIDRKLKPTIALCMGEEGLASRVLAKKFGAMLTFASLDEHKGTAPGQPMLEQLKTLYRWDAIGRDTGIFGVIGHPVGHSLSPAIHNAGFTAMGFDGVYLPMPIPPEYEHFKATVLSWLDMPGVDFRGLRGFRGASVTIPHKENLLRLVLEQGGVIEPLSKTIGAANTLIVRDDGTLEARNTDYGAALDAVCDALTLTRDKLQGKRVVVLGAGGVSRAIVAGFAHAGCEVMVLNRTLEKAQALAEPFGASHGSLDDASDISADIWINGTSVGMHPHVDASPLPTAPGSWNNRTVIFDTIYNPHETLLLRNARRAGCITVAGAEMFVRQAGAQFEAWTGLPPPLDVFRSVVMKKLKQG
jgi:3-dehydroquinate dehydratase/shikimate dehydrogenase